MAVVIVIITAEGGGWRGESSGDKGKGFHLTAHLPEVTFKLSAGAKGVSVALDEPDVTGGEKG